MSGEAKPKALEQLCSLIEGLGYRARVEDNHIVSSATGMRLAINHYPGSIQVAGGISDVPEVFGLEDINAFNGRFRFGTLYQSDGALILQANFLMDPFQDEAEALVEQIFAIFEGLASELRSAIADRLQPETAEAAGVD